MSAFIQKYRNVDGNSNFSLGDELVGDGSSTSKISIMAPAGTVFEINHKSITIGPSGIYDFDNEDIEITSIKLPAGESHSAERQALAQILAQFKSDFETLASGPETAETPNDWGDFCRQAKLLYSSTTHSDQSGHSETLASAITNYLAKEKDYANLNDGVRDVVVNYITN